MSRSNLQHQRWSVHRLPQIPSSIVESRRIPGMVVTGIGMPNIKRYVSFRAMSMREAFINALGGGV